MPSFIFITDLYHISISLPFYAIFHFYYQSNDQCHLYILIDDQMTEKWCEKVLNTKQLEKSKITKKKINYKRPELQNKTKKAMLQNSKGVKQQIHHSHFKSLFHSTQIKCNLILFSLTWISFYSSCGKFTYLFLSLINLIR